jgi:hypothetical protein
VQIPENHYVVSGKHPDAVLDTYQQDVLVQRTSDPMDAGGNLYIGVYVDHIILVGERIKEVKDFLFDIKYMESLSGNKYPVCR